jgi:hypothetical protein
MVNAADKSFRPHTYLRSIGNNMHIMRIHIFTTNAVNRQIHPVPGLLSYHKMLKYFSAIAKCNFLFSGPILSNVPTSIPNIANRLRGLSELILLFHNF